MAWQAWPRLTASLPDRVASDFRAYRSGLLPLDLISGDLDEVEGFFERAGMGFETRVFDLAMMQFTVEGARVHRLSGRPSALFVYAGTDARRLVCEMYPGRVDELPTGANRRTNNGIEFHVFDRAGLTLAFWQEGDVVCVLVGGGPPEEVIQLAFAKAVNV